MFTPKNVNLRQNARKINTEEKLVKYIKTQLGADLITVDISDDQILNCIDTTFSKFSAWALDAQQHMTFVINTTAGVQDYYIDDRIYAIYGISVADSNTSYGGSAGGITLGGFGEIGINYIPYVNMQGDVSSLETGSGSGNYSATGVAGGVTGGPATSGNAGEQMEMAYAMMLESQMMSSMFGSSMSFDFNSQNHILRLFESVQQPIMIEAAMNYVPNPLYDDSYNHTWIKGYALNLSKRVWGENVGKYSQSLIGGATINFDRIISEAQSELDKLDEDLLNKYSEPLGIFSS